MSGTNQGMKADRELSPRLRKRWVGYAAAAAGAACITPATQASIIYQPKHYTVTVNSELTLPIGEFGSEVNFDCLNPTTAGQCVSWARGRFVSAGDKFTEQRTNPYPMLSGVGEGSLIGASKQFGGGFFLFSRSGPASNTHFFWNGGSFLGFELPLGGGQYDFGWVQVSLQSSRQTPYSSHNYGWAIHINGYAYDTIPNQPIRAGDTGTPEPGTLGLLALGSLGLGFWRRRKATSIAE